MTFDYWWDEKADVFKGSREHDAARQAWNAAIKEAASLVDREEGSPSLTDKVRALSAPQEER